MPALVPSRLAIPASIWLLVGAATAEQVFVSGARPAWAAEAAELSSSPLLLQDYRPQSMLRVPAHPRVHARFPVVDVHTHFTVRLHDSEEGLDDFVRAMDQQQIAVCASMDAKLGDTWQEHANYLWRRYPDRFVVFVHVDWQGSGSGSDPASWDCHRPDFARQVARLLATARQQGASGVKIFKQLGLGYRNPDKTLVRIDDPRWDPIWAACGELGLPIMMHTADPMAFFLPVDKQNERWDELQRHPDWSFYGGDFPKYEELLDARNRVIARHPRTQFIGAHVASSAEDLQQVGHWLDQYPNLTVDLASRISELGRQPYTAREFFLRYQDRILFGTDGPWPTERLALYWRFLETRDEYFPYSEKPFPPQGLWSIYGVELPDEVLRKVYHENACRLIPGVRERWEKFSKAFVPP